MGLSPKFHVRFVRLFGVYGGVISIKDGHDMGTLFACLKNVFASKSTNTLNSRVGPMVRYVFYCKSSQQEAFPLLNQWCVFLHVARGE